MKKQLLLFDFDGTIADTFQQIIAISNRLSKEFHFKVIKDNEIDILKNSTVDQAIEFLKVPKLKVPQILLKARKELHNDILNIEPIHGLSEILLKLKSAGHPMGIITTNSAKNVKAFLSHHDLDVFDFVSSTSKIFGKSNSLKRIIKKKKFDLNNSYYIGDEIRDIIAAQKVGIEVIAVTWGFNSKQSLKKQNPSHLIHKPMELFNIFQSI